MATAAEPAPALPLDQLIIQDHNKVRYLFSEYGKATAAEVKQQLAYTIIRELCMHSSKEEEVVYPAMGKHFGPEVQQHLLDEHMSLKVMLDKLNGMDMYKQENECDALIANLKTTFEHHIQTEENTEVPRLLQAPGVDAMDLGMQFQKAAAHAITRPHPMAPDKPPMNIAANMATAPADALADQIRFAGHTPEVNPPA